MIKDQQKKTVNEERRLKLKEDRGVVVTAVCIVYLLIKLYTQKKIVYTKKKSYKYRSPQSISK